MASAEIRLEASELARRAARIRLLLLDVDGVLTDGHLAFTGDGEAGQVFHIHDGLGLQLARSAGLLVGLLSGRASASVARRARDLGLDHVVLGRPEKGSAFTELLDALNLSADEVAYVGDDLPDLAVLRRCGIGYCPADAVAEVRATAHVVLCRNGGRGAVREVVEHLLTSRGQWAAVLDRFA
jgi:3-deoxy-D-manno-octulosonate 8-phosphate phosphatase (KDO 8-P phosphatase)